MEIGPEKVCQSCQQKLPDGPTPLTEDQTLQPTRRNWKPTLAMVQRFRDAMDERALDAALPLPPKEPAAFRKHRDEFLKIMCLLAREGSMKLGELLEAIKHEIALTDAPLKERLVAMHDYGLIDIDPPPDEASREIEFPRPRPDGLRHNVRWISLSVDGELSLQRLTMMRDWAHEEAVARGFTIANAVDAAVNVDQVIAAARKAFDETVRLSDEDLDQF